MKLHTRDINSSEPLKYVAETNEEVYAVGEVLKVASGALTKNAETDASPKYISQAAGTGVTGGLHPVIEIQPDMQFETTFYSASTAAGTVVVGDKVTLHTDGVQATFTTASGIAEIVAFPSGVKKNGEPVIVEL